MFKSTFLHDENIFLIQIFFCDRVWVIEIHTNSFGAYLDVPNGRDLSNLFIQRHPTDQIVDPRLNWLGGILIYWPLILRRARDFHRRER